MNVTPLELDIIQEITKDLKKLWTVNELARTLDKHYRPIYAATQRLLKRGVLGKNANGLIHPLFQNTDLFLYAEKQRVSQLTRKDLRIISNKLQMMPSSFFCAILFGSSTLRKGRDIDLLLILPDCENIDNFRKNSELVLGSFMSTIDLNIVHESSCFEMLNKPHQLNVMNEVLKNHLVLFGAEYFYTLIRRWMYAQ